MGDRLVAGIDVGTNGARCMLVDLRGNVVATAAEPIAASAGGLPDGWSEQDPEEWWRATCVACRAAFAHAGGAARALAGLAVDSTSGTIVPVGAEGTVLRPALMYNDVRAVEETEIV